MVKNKNPKQYDGIDIDSDIIDENTFELIIDRAIKKRCFVEAVTLIHNAIEHYLKYKIHVFIVKSHSIDPHFNFQTQEEYDNYVKQHIDNKILEKFKLINGEHKKNQYLKYLSDYNELAYIFNLIDENLYNDILKFNSERNKIIHIMLKKSGKYAYKDIIEISKLGRKIQLKLSPIDFSDEDLKRILGLFDISQDEKEDDAFL